MSELFPLLSQNIDSVKSAFDNLLRSPAQIEAYKLAVSIVLKSYRNNGRLYLAGNGGSAADAQHIAAEFVSKLARERAPLPAEALTVDSSVLTSIGNDFGFKYIFSRQLIAKLNSQDVFLGITTSGNSENIIEAIKVCSSKKIPSIVFTGRDGGNVAEIADVTIIVQGDKTSTIQEAHILLGHTLCEFVESKIFFENRG